MKFDPVIELRCPVLHFFVTNLCCGTYEMHIFSELADNVVSGCSGCSRLWHKFDVFSWDNFRL